MMLRLVPGSPPTLASPWPRTLPWDSPTLSPTDQHRLAVCCCRVLCSRIANAGLRGSTLHPPSIPLPLWLLHSCRSCALPPRMQPHRKHGAQGQHTASPQAFPCHSGFSMAAEVVHCCRIANTGFRGRPGTHARCVPPSVPLPLWPLHSYRNCALWPRMQLDCKRRAQRQGPCTAAAKSSPPMQLQCIRGQHHSTVVHGTCYYSKS